MVANPGINEVTLTWETPIGGAQPEGYYVHVNGPDGFTKTLSTQTDSNELTASGLKNGTEYRFSVIAATRNGSAAASDVVSATPSTGMEGVVAGMIVEFESGSQKSPGETDVPGEDRIDQVDLTVAERVTDDAVLVELSEPVDLDTAKQIAADLSADEQVTWAEPDQFFFTSTGAATSDSLASPVSVPADSQYGSDQWNLWDTYGISVGDSANSMTDAWAGPRGDGTTVAVIDTGVTDHPDLVNQLVPGYDFVSNPEQLASSRQANAPPVAFDGDYTDQAQFGALGRDANPTDPGDWRGVAPVRDSSWHGTKMAGIIAAEANADGITGIAPNAKIQPIRALSWRGGLLSDIAASITWASGGTVDGVPANTTPSKVINLSFAVETTCPVALQGAIDGALERGSILVAAAGNANDDASKYAPGNCNGVITVGATNRDGVRADYSNYGTTIDISAPGGDGANPITTASNTGSQTPNSATTAADYGTSVSTAHVSAAAAILTSRNRDLTPQDAFAQLTGKDFTKDFAHPTCDPIHPDFACGAGILSLSEALAQVAGYTTSTDRSMELDVSTHQYARGTIANITATGTLMAWVKPQSVANQMVVLADYRHISITTGSWRGRAMTTDVPTEVAVRQDEWQHVAMTWDATSVSFYVDGVLATTVASGASGLSYGHIEISSSGSALRFDGDVDEVKVYSSVLTQTQILADMHTHGMNSSVPSADHVAYYDFNYTEATATTIENLVSGAASSTDLTATGSPTLNDVASSETSGSTTTWTFDRSYLTADGGWTAPSWVDGASGLIVGGGGGGGRGVGGGGGGGGVKAYAAGSVPVTAGAVVPVTVGMGGLGGSTSIATASAGQASYLGTASAGGGGAGGAGWASGGNAPTGFTQRGSGGGAGEKNSELLAGGIGTYSGGSSNSTQAAGGGAGSSAAGATVSSGSTTGGAGGAGTSSSISGASVVYGSGGGGAGDAVGGAGGTNAGNGGTNGAGTSAVAGRGGGGGGADIGSSGYFTAGSGGSGAVILSYTTYTLTYNANTATSGSPPTQETLVAGATTTLTAGTLAKTGYTFAGWQTTSSGGTTYAVGASYTMPSMDTTLYAYWTTNSYTVSYNANGGSGTPPSTVTVNYNATTTVASGSTLTRTGYTFAGWNTNSGGTGTSYAEGSTLTMGTANVTLYAKWTIRTYRLSYTTMGATGGSPPTSIDLNYNSTTSVDSGTGFTRPGYTFLRWRDPNTGTFYNAGSTFTMPAYNVQLEAQWTAVLYTFSFNPNGGGNTPAGGTRYYNQSISGTCFGTARGGYTLSGWESDYDSSVYSTACATPGFFALSGFTMPASNVVFTAQWTANTYNVTFDSKGGSAVTGGTYNTGGTLAEPTAPAKAGYTFAGWSLTDAGSAVTWTSGNYSPVGFGDFTMYALWSADTYTVTFDSKGGTSVSNGSYSTGGTLAEPTAPTKAGYTFAGWSLTDGGSAVTWTSGFYSPAGYGNITMYALWVAYSVIYDDNGGSGGPGSIPETAGATITVSATEPTRTGYTFDGWTSSLGGSVVAGDTFTMPLASVTLTAEWTLVPVPPSPSGTSTSTSPSGIVIRPMTDDDGWEAIGSGFLVMAKPQDASGASLPLGQSQRLEVPRGGSLQVLGDGFVPGSTMSIVLAAGTFPRASPRMQALTSTVGDFSELVPIPMDAPLGEFPLTVTGLTNQDGSTTVVFSVTVVENDPVLVAEKMQRASFFQGGSLKFTDLGRKRVADILEAIPTDATNIEVTVVGVSVTRDSLSENLDLARDRAEKLARTFESRGLSGTYTVGIATQIIVEAKPKPRSIVSRVISDGGDASTALEPNLSSTGKPLTTVSVSYDTLQ